MFQEILNDVEEYLKIDARNDDDPWIYFFKTLSPYAAGFCLGAKAYGRLYRGY